MNLKIKNKRDKTRPLVEKFIRDRDERSFDRLYQAATPTIYGLAWRLLGPESETVNDVIQESWLRAVQKIHQFRGDAKFETWLSAIVIRCCQEIFRGRQREGGEKLEIPEKEGTDLNVSLTLESVVESLPDGYRRVLVLHDIEGYKHREIADLLGIDEGTSRSQLSHARKTLRSMLNENPS